MSELLLELFSEEIPALMHQKAQEAFVNIFTKSLNNNHISFDDLKVYIGARRITLYVTGLQQSLEWKEEIKGPKIDAEESAIDGFCRNNNIQREDLSQKLIKNQFCYIYKPDNITLDISDRLSNLLPLAIMSYIWPKSMIWGNYDLRWVRPLRNILCLLDNKVLPIKLAHLTANNITFVHRSINKNAIQIKNFLDYKMQLQTHYVILDHIIRKSIIRNQLTSLAHEYNLILKIDEKLLEEVTGLVEYPTIMIGKIMDQFMLLPREILISSMATHQKYFTLFNKDDSFAPYFLFVSNMIPEQHISMNLGISVIAGNEKVLFARLSDALYFYQQDLSKQSKSTSPHLQNIIFHEKLGTLLNKVERIAKICDYLSDNEPELHIAATLCKNDLLSLIVEEFPDLQGIMGYYYAKNAGYNDNIAMAIRDHYKPQGMSDQLAMTENGKILALADKVDALVGFMLAGEQATGSSDPYALRRHALAIVKINSNLKNSLFRDLKDIIRYLIELYHQQNFLLDVNIDVILVKLFDFLENRTKFYFKAIGCYDMSLINAIIDQQYAFHLGMIQSRLDITQEFMISIKGKELLNSYKRINNILENVVSHDIINIAIFNSYAINLYKCLELLSNKLSHQYIDSFFKESLNELCIIITHLTTFFDNVMINDANQAIYNNNIALLRYAKNLFNRIIKFDYLI